ncbi:TetR/AcrR family transcriptional regulator [Microbacterium sp. cf332]|uniref:TetR/AcrR family transcriptional regulator n=1 Tax=Microbacterium sp. cf332 TaxID=1761804 RepID=UPI00089192EB|nr:TetR/AcrR family transcriptional regulator [Microbacterium sp. cf332]SDQ64844.1 transcriptional regulator, TetR family [Microbacterium sp. cf332]
MSTAPAAAASGSPAPARRRGPRQDVARNKAALLAATGELLRDDPDSATMPAIAARAGLSVATAYRYYPSLDELHREYLLNVLDQLVHYAATLDLDGADLFEAVLGKWFELVVSHGPAMVLVRSREGFLTRLARGERHARIIDAAWGPAIRELMRIEDADETLYDYALATCNALFNSRELLDLHTVARRAPSHIIRDLTETYRGTLRGIARTTYP